MSKLDNLIEKMCPNGVEYKPIWSLTAWDKKFNGVDKEKQKNVISYKYYLSTDFAKVEKKNGNIKYISTGISGDDRYTTEELAGDYLAEGEVVCIPWGGTPNVKYHKGKFVTGDNRIATSLDVNILSNKFLYYWMQSKINVISKFYRGSGIKHPSMKDVLDMNIAVPPLEVQCEIVHILDDFTLLSAELSAELKARQKKYEYYKDILLKNYSSNGNIMLKEIAEYSKDKINAEELNEDNYVGVDNLLPNKQGKKKSNHIPQVGNSTKYHINDILIGNIRPYLKKIWYANNKGGTNGDVLVIHITNERVNPQYLYYILSSDKFFNYDTSNSKGAKMPRGNKDAVMKYKFFLPTMEEQNKIVNILDKFEKLCNDISEGLPAEIEARQKQYEYYRDKLLTFKELKVNE